MWKFAAKLDIVIPGKPPKMRVEEYVFGVSNINLANLNFTQGFTKILLNKLEDENWINEFIVTGIEIQLKLEEYKKANYIVKYDQVIEEVTEFR